MTASANTDYPAPDRVAMGASAGFALAYFLSLPLEPYAGIVAVKGAAVFLLAVVAWRQLKSTNGRLLALGLLISSVGDVFLRIDAVGLFVEGLASFLIAHLCYVAIFVRLTDRPLSLSGPKKTLITLLLIYGAALAAWLLPHLGAYAAPVMIYAVAITVMGVTSVLAGFSRPWVALGAVLFILSDSAIAIDRFLFSVEGIGYFIWPSYYIGQLLIMTGVISAARQP
jgi:uncharacterized membrane protein YhhN